MVAALIGLAVVVGLIALGLSTDDKKSDEDRAAATETQPQTQTERTRTKKKPPPPTTPATPTRVVLRRSRPETPTYACLDRGAGTPVIYEGTLDAARTFRAPACA